MNICKFNLIVLTDYYGTPHRRRVSKFKGGKKPANLVAEEYKLYVINSLFHFYCADR